MKKIINIYSNNNFSNIIKTTFSNFNIKTHKIKHCEKINPNHEISVIFLTKKSEIENLDIKNYLKNTIFICIDRKIKIKNLEATVLQAPIEIKKLKDCVLKIMNDINDSFGDLKIIDRKIINTKNELTSILTESEKKILSMLIENNSYERDEIKRKVLNINKNINTNSLDSHLTRIRKKLEKIKSDVKISSKEELLVIDY